MSVNDGGPAFPQPMTFSPNGQPTTPGMYFPDVNGMSLRDWFAGLALQGWLSGPCQGDVLDDYDHDPKAFSQHQKIVGETCYGYADAMLAARERKEDA